MTKFKKYKVSLKYLKRKSSAALNNFLSSIDDNSVSTNEKVEYSLAAPCLINNNTESSAVLNKSDSLQTSQTSISVVSSNTYENSSLTSVIAEQINTENSIASEICFTSASKTLSNLLAESVSDKEFLARWIVESNISHRAANKLLKFLHNKYKSKSCMGYVPKDVRTLLKSSNKKVPAKLVSEGTMNNKSYFSHLGLRKALIHIVENSNNFKKIDNSTSEEVLLSLNINVDGLPISNSKYWQMWPIQVLVTNADYSHPEIVSLFTGETKPPSVKDYLDEFVKELRFLSKNQFYVNNNAYRIDINKCIFVADSPARAFIKQNKGHNSKHGCDFCSQEGTFVKNVEFETVIGSTRTNAQFRAQDDEDHHNGQSPLVKVSELDMINNFPVEPMHNVFLGVMKKLLIYWTSKPTTHRLSPKLKIEISNKTIFLGKFLKGLFSRQQQGIFNVSQWKATEFKSFLLYVGVLSLKDSVSNKVYKNFLLFHSAIHILSNEKFSKTDAEYANSLLTQFVAGCAKLYGSRFISYNVHTVMHLPHFVKKFGTIDKFSCFPFENNLGQLKPLLRTRYRPHQQVIKRLDERKKWNTKIKTNNESQTVIKYLPKKVIEINGKLSFVRSLRHVKQKIIIEAREVRCLRPLYTYPHSSTKFDIYLGKDLGEPIELSILCNSKIKAFMCFPYKNAYALFPLNH